ncbi:MAG: hypothetical protein NZ853_08760 [Leptospiraceae bacterium]|nr:hypothetical protein [Leptospiraceae bacterium]
MRSWRPENEREAEYKKNYIQTLKSRKKDILDFLLETEPTTTIPLFEKQNN